MMLCFVLALNACRWPMRRVRYDQTVLSIVAYQFHVSAQPHIEFLAASSPSSNFRQPTFKRLLERRGKVATIMQMQVTNIEVESDV